MAQWVKIHCRRTRTLDQMPALTEEPRSSGVCPQCQFWGHKVGWIPGTCRHARFPIQELKVQWKVLSEKLRW